MQTPRPSFVGIAADLAEPVIREWFEDFVRHQPMDWLNKAVSIIDGHDRKELGRILRSVFQTLVNLEQSTTIDGYRAARLFEDYLNKSVCKPWPVNARVVSAFQTAIDMAEVSIANAERRWVLETGTRLTSRHGERVNYRRADTLYTGTVDKVDIGRARMTVSTPNGSDTVLYEEVVR